MGGYKKVFNSRRHRHNQVTIKDDLIYVPIYLLICLLTYMSICVFFSIYRGIYVYLCKYLSVSRSVYLSIDLSADSLLYVLHFSPAVTIFSP